MRARIDYRLGQGALSRAGVGLGKGSPATRWITKRSGSLVQVMASPGSEQQPEWVIRQPDPKSGRRTGLCHLMRKQRPAFSTLCGLEKAGWQRWPPGLSRPPMDMCCKRCMTVAMKEILEGRYELR